MAAAEPASRRKGGAERQVDIALHDTLQQARKIGCTGVCAVRRSAPGLIADPIAIYLQNFHGHRNYTEVAAAVNGLAEHMRTVP